MFWRILAVIVGLVCVSPVTGADYVGQWRVEMSRFNAAERAFQTRNYSEALPLLQHFADENKTFGIARRAQSQYHLAELYLHGWGVDKNVETAILWFKKSFESGRTDAGARIADIYLAGDLVPENLAEAAIWYRKALEQGDRRAEYMLIFPTLRAQGMAKDQVRALIELRKAAQCEGNAMAELGSAYLAGGSMPTNTRAALTWYQHAADAGSDDIDALTRLGSAYLDGIALRKDYEQAHLLLAEAAALGGSEAQGKLGFMYATGTGVTKDYAKALAWFRKAAEQGDANAVGALGFLYEKGHGVKRNAAQAIVYYRKAAAAGDRTAQLRLAAFYRQGRLGRPNVQQALFWQRKAAARRTMLLDKNFVLPIDAVTLSFERPEERGMRQRAELGDVTAQRDLGLKYAQCQCTERYRRQALLWFGRAARQGDKEAQFRLAELYEKGDGITDKARAFRWYRAAARQGDAEAQFRVAGRYNTGLGVKANGARAVFWMRKAVAAEHSKAQLALAGFYERGRHVRQNWGRAEKLYEKVADLPSYEESYDRNISAVVQAEFHLGMIYETKLSGRRDDAKAAKWYERAANNDCFSEETCPLILDARLKMARFYGEGRGVALDVAQSIYWTVRFFGDPHGTYLYPRSPE